MKDVKIIIPSHKRADRVLTTGAVFGAALCVAESQADAYRKSNPGIEIIEHPDSVLGVSRKRQWIIQNVGSCFMVDDDIDQMNRIYTEKGDEHRVDPATAYDIVQATAYSAKQAGAYLFGFSFPPSPKTYNSFKPIALKGFVNGCALGILEGSKLWYNTDIRCNDDYWICLLNAYYHRFAWIDERYHWGQKDTFKNRGGNSEFRNIEAEEQDYRLLKRVFGDAINLRKKNKGISSSHEFQKSITLPF